MTVKIDSAFSQELNQMEELKTSESEQMKTKELLNQIEARLKEVEQSTADLKKRTVEYFERIDRQKKELENPNTKTKANLPFLILITTIIAFVIVRRSKR